MFFIASEEDLTSLKLGIILSGSPYSVYDADSPQADPDVYTLGVPILGICYGLHVSGSRSIWPEFHLRRLSDHGIALQGKGRTMQ